MYRIDNATASVAIPTPAAVGPKPNAYFTKGNPGGGVPATIVDDDWANAVQEEIANVILGAGITLDKTVRTQLLSAIAGKLGRIRLAANTNFYVRSDGSNSNNGLANTAGGAFLTLQYAVTYISNFYDANGFTITINPQAGTFAGFSAGVAPLGLPSPMTINGLGATTLINTPIIAAAGANIRVQNLTCGVAAGSAVIATNGGQLYVGAGIICSGAQGGSNGCFAATFNGILQIEQNLSVSGGAGSLFYTQNGGIIFGDSRTITLSGTPAFSVATAVAQFNSQINLTAITFAGTGATGTRYATAMNGTIWTSGGGANYFPGNAVGSSATGGQYG